MGTQLTISLGEATSKGRKEINQDFHDLCIPSEPQLTTKGIAVALADGISSSDVSQIASKTAVTSFLMDYFSTSDSWSVKKSAQRVLYATNSWLFSQSKQGQYAHDKDKGYVCTFSAMVFRSNTAYMFHIGDARIYRLRDGQLERLTEDHRLWVGQDTSYLSRALGMDSVLNVDYDSFPLEVGDLFFFMTDGVYEHIDEDILIETISTHENDLQKATQILLDEAYDDGSTDNLTIQIVKIDTLPTKDVSEVDKQLIDKPLPPLLETRMDFDGYEIVQELHGSSRSHVYLAVDKETGTKVVIKTPSIDLQNDKAYLERFLMEEWIAIRMNSPYLIKSYLPTRKRNFLYNVTEFIEGQTLTQWMIDNPKPSLEVVRNITEQIAKGLLAMHRQEMIHQDLRPENIMIDSSGTVKIIDFGSTRVEGIADINSFIEQENLQGTAQYSAPEYFIGEMGSSRSDLYSLGLIVYQMISGKLPYGVSVARAKTKAEQKKLKYTSLYTEEGDTALWVDETLRKALEIDPYDRYSELSEFTYDLRHPNEQYLKKSRPPLLERNPVFFWKMVSLTLATTVVGLLYELSKS
jgi:serine/threonine protein kinase/serine/threonine protein phosphatase PrpC